MATPGRLKDIAAERGQTIPEMLSEIVRAEGNISRAARRIKVTPRTIYRWIDRHDYDVKRSAEVIQVASK